MKKSTHTSVNIVTKGLSISVIYIPMWKTFMKKWKKFHMTVKSKATKKRQAWKFKQCNVIAKVEDPNFDTSVPKLELEWKVTVFLWHHEDWNC